MSKFEKYTIIMVIVGLGVTLWIHKSSNSSVLSFSAVQSTDGQYTTMFEENRIITAPVFFKLKFSITVRNIGNSSATIESISFMPVKTSKEKIGVRWDKAMEYPVRIALDTPDRTNNMYFTNGKPLVLPITIAPQRALHFEKAFNIPIPFDVWDKIKEKVGIKQVLLFTDVSRFFYEEDVECWGYLNNHKVTDSHRYYLVSLLKENGETLKGEIDVCHWAEFEENWLKKKLF